MLFTRQSAKNGLNDVINSFAICKGWPPISRLRIYSMDNIKALSIHATSDDPVWLANHPNINFSKIDFFVVP